MAEPMGCAVGLDPGHSKCGLACSDANQQHLDLCLICTPHQCWRHLQDWWLERQPSCLYLGDGTGSARWRTALLTWWPAHALRLVSELDTSREARARYWRFHAPRGWQRLLPEGLRQPPGPVDHLAALVILERGLGHSLTVTSSSLPAARTDVRP